MFKKDNLAFGLILGTIAPLLGLLLLKYKKFGMLTFKEVFQFLYTQPTQGLLTAGLTISLMMNAFLFTFYVNNRSDKTAKGLFITTISYGVIILCIKFFGR